MLDDLQAASPTWRQCPDCEVHWESDDQACWLCGRVVEAAKWMHRPKITSQAQPVRAMQDWECRARKLPT